MTEPPAEQPTDAADVFPELVVDDEHDPLGVELANRITRDVAGILPTAGVKPKRRRTEQQRFSGSGPDDRDPKLIMTALTEEVAQRGWHTEFGVRVLLTRWPSIVGEVNAEHCQPVAFKNQILQVQAESTTWATVLRQMAPQIVARLNAELGDGSVQRIEVRGPAAPSWKHGIRSVRDGRGPRDTYG